MKNRFLTFGLIFALFVPFSVITGLSFNNEDGEAFTNSSSELSAVAKCQEKKEKKEVYVYITKKSKIKISLKDACKRGYTSCKVCKPPKCPNNK